MNFDGDGRVLDEKFMSKGALTPHPPPPLALVLYCIVAKL
jgi:hypothetical protein